MLGHKIESHTRRLRKRFGRDYHPFAFGRTSEGAALDLNNPAFHVRTVNIDITSGVDRHVPGSTIASWLQRRGTGDPYDVFTFGVELVYSTAADIRDIHVPFTIDRYPRRKPESNFRRCFFYARLVLQARVLRESKPSELTYIFIPRAIYPKLINHVMQRISNINIPIGAIKRCTCGPTQTVLEARIVDRHTRIRNRQRRESPRRCLFPCQFPQDATSRSPAFSTENTHQTRPDIEHKHVPIRLVYRHTTQIGTRTKGRE